MCCQLQLNGKFIDWVTIGHLSFALLWVLIQEMNNEISRRLNDAPIICSFFCFHHQQHPLNWRQLTPKSKSIFMVSWINYSQVWELVRGMAFILQAFLVWNGMEWNEIYILMNPCRMKMRSITSLSSKTVQFFLGIR